MVNNKHSWKKCFDNMGKVFKNIKGKNIETDYVSIRPYELADFRLKLGVFTPFYYIKDSSAFENSQEFLELKGKSKPVFAIYSKEKPGYKLITPIVFIRDNDIVNETNIKRLKMLILRELQAQCSLSEISPYETDAVVSGDKFFGRKTELNRILSNETTNFVIFGSRRMGKTSLLKHLEHLYNTEKFSPDTDHPNSGKAIFLSCLSVRSLSSFQELLISALAPSVYWKDGFQKLMGKKSREVYTQNYFKNLAKRYNRGIVLLLDEIDAMIESPDCDRIVKFQRMLSTVGYRFIQTGYRAVWEEMQNIEGNFWNFSEPLHIAQFNRHESMELIEKPMENMGIKLAEGVAARIYQETGGIPNYIQHYCSVIVSEAESGSRKIDKEVFGIIDGSSNFDRIVMNSIHQNLRVLSEKLIVYFAVSESKRQISIFQILDFCKKQQIYHILYDEIRKSMNILMKMGFVQPVGEDLYRLIAPIIIKALRKRNIEKNLADTIKELKEKND